MSGLARSQSVKVNLEELWEAVDTLKEENRRLLKKIQEIEVPPPPDFSTTSVDDLKARMETVEAVLWGEDTAS